MVKENIYRIVGEMTDLFHDSQWLFATLFTVEAAWSIGVAVSSDQVNF